MKKLLLTLLVLSITFNSFSQRLKKTFDGESQTINDSIASRQSTSNRNLVNKEAKITDYLIISHQRDTTYVDTTLTIAKEYKFNYLRKDNVELISFSNLGQTYNTLAYDFNDNPHLMPLFGARARHFNYMEVEDIYYYHVPTPLTELMYKSAFEQGQLVDAFFTTNISKQINFSIAYKGLRSLGKYQHILTSTGNFRFTTSYKTKNKRYIANAHFVSQDLMNQENGGLQNSNVPYFEEGIQEFKDRGVLDVNFENAESILVGKRFHLDHLFNIIESDSLSTNKLNIENIISFEDKYFEFTQDNADDFFGDAFKNSNLRDRSTLENFYTQLKGNYSNKHLGDVSVSGSYTNFNYGYDKVVNLDGTWITNRLKGDAMAFGASYKNKIGQFNLYGDIGANISGDFDGNYVTGGATFNLAEDILIGAQINHNSHAPNYNFLLYQSDYINYNWQNSFKNVETQNLRFTFQSKKIANVSVDITSLDNYAYFARDLDSMVKPFQNDKTIAYLKVKAENEFKVGKFALHNTFIYQNVSDDNKVLNVPKFITRNTLYYTNRFFKNELLLQTGVTFNYFTEYHMNAYDPALAEFYVQTNRKYGNFPRFDFFVDGKIRTMRIFLKLEHFNASLSGYNYYSAPNYPYRDMIFRFGVVWNFFL